MNQKVKAFFDKVMSIYNKIFPYFKIVWAFLKTPLFLYLVLIILFLFLGVTCSNLNELKRKNNIHEQNIDALKDTIRKEKTKSGSLQISVSGYIAKERELKDLNRDLYNEIKDQKGRVISLNTVVIKLNLDKNELEKHINYLESVMGKPIHTNDSTYIIPWTMKYDWDTINYDYYEGKTQVGVKVKPGFVWKDGMTNDYVLGNAINLEHYGTILTAKSSRIKLTFGQKMEDNKLRIFVKTDYPGFTAESMKGVLIDPNTNPDIKKLMKKRKLFPNTWTVGVGPSYGFDVINGKPYFGVGAQINYNILQW